MPDKNILLIEPSYKNKYPPLGLMKIAQYHGPRGKQDRVMFVKGEDPCVFGTAWDRIYVTTLFSFEFTRIAQSIDFALGAANGYADKVFVGGIAASLMREAFTSEPRWRGVRFIQGLLDRSPAISLQLDDFSEELYADDRNGTAIEDLIPDYSILDQISYKYPVHDAYFAYASRGCIRKCSFCGVPKLEGVQRDTNSLAPIVEAIVKYYGPKKDLILMDNNIVASARFKEIIAQIRDMGFVPGAKLNRGRIPIQRRVDFNQGVDARILCRDAMYMRELSKICLRPLRIAFDHLGLKRQYDQAVRYAHEFGLRELSNYMLYNFHDTPMDLYERMRLNVFLNEELGIRIWSFPMRYQPTDLRDRSHIGEHWTRYQLRSLQIILQATHGVVSGEPVFFKRAFGDTYAEFESILLRPHHFIFNRDWYETLNGRAEFDEYNAAMAKLSHAERFELLALLSSSEPSQFGQIPNGRAVSDSVRNILSFYRRIPKAEEARIWRSQSNLLHSCKPISQLAEDERIEDAGLEENVEVSHLHHLRVRKR
jgi:hypothetical protein